MSADKRFEETLDIVRPPTLEFKKVVYSYRRTGEEMVQTIITREIEYLSGLNPNYSFVSVESPKGRNGKSIAVSYDESVTFTIKFKKKL